jgi:hypothetical protein
MRHLKLILIAAIVGIAILGATLSILRDYGSATFAGNDFILNTPDDTEIVYTEFKDYLSKKGFYATQSPSDFDSWTGVHSDKSERYWFRNNAEKNQGTYIYIDLSDHAIRTSIKWEAYGFRSDQRNAKETAYLLAIELNDWFSLRPEKNHHQLLDYQMKQKSFEEQIVKLKQG